MRGCCFFGEIKVSSLVSKRRHNKSMHFSSSFHSPVTIFPLGQSAIVRSETIHASVPAGVISSSEQCTCQIQHRRCSGRRFRKPSSRCIRLRRAQMSACCVSSAGRPTILWKRVSLCTLLSVPSRTPWSHRCSAADFRVANRPTPVRKQEVLLWRPSMVFASVIRRDTSAVIIGPEEPSDASFGGAMPIVAANGSGTLACFGLSKRDFYILPNLWRALLWTQGTSRLVDAGCTYSTTSRCWRCHEVYGHVGRPVLAVGTPECTTVAQEAGGSSSRNAPPSSSES